MLTRKSNTLFASRHTIQSTIKRLSREIEYDYLDKDPIFIGILSGSFIFLADLVRNIPIEMEIDFCSVSSYTNNIQTTKPIFNLLPKVELHGRNVVVVEDILDTGTTIEEVVNCFKLLGCNSIEVVSLFKRKSCTYPAKYVGIVVEDNEFLVGYGLDDCGRKRNLSDVYSLK